MRAGTERSSGRERRVTGGTKRLGPIVKGLSNDEIAELSVETASNYLDAIERIMVKNGIRRADLARRLGVDRGAVTQHWKGYNPKLWTMIEVATAVGAVIKISVEERQ